MNIEILRVPAVLSALLAPTNTEALTEAISKQDSARKTT
jgi:hypothetical protein